jgi:hypothetical protein
MLCTFPASIDRSREGSPLPDSSEAARATPAEQRGRRRLARAISSTPDSLKSCRRGSARLQPLSTRRAISAFFGPALLQPLRARHADALIVTGSKTDVCVSATIIAAVDHGYRVILVRDGVCSPSDEGHDALLQLYHRRFREQPAPRKSWRCGAEVFSPRSLVAARR